MTDLRALSLYRRTLNALGAGKKKRARERI
jgi:hypothetical protein